MDSDMTLTSGSHSLDFFGFHWILLLFRQGFWTILDILGLEINSSWKLPADSEVAAAQGDQAAALVRASEVMDFRWCLDMFGQFCDPILWSKDIQRIKWPPFLWTNGGAGALFLPSPPIGGGPQTNDCARRSECSDFEPRYVERCWQSKPVQADYCYVNSFWAPL